MDAGLEYYQISEDEPNEWDTSSIKIIGEISSKENDKNIKRVREGLSKFNFKLLHGKDKVKIESIKNFDSETINLDKDKKKENSFNVELEEINLKQVFLKDSTHEIEEDFVIPSKKEEIVEMKIIKIKYLEKYGPKILEELSKIYSIDNTFLITDKTSDKILSKFIEIQNSKKLTIEQLKDFYKDLEIIEVKKPNALKLNFEKLLSVIYESSNFIKENLKELIKTPIQKEVELINEEKNKDFKTLDLEF